LPDVQKKPATCSSRLCYLQLGVVLLK